VDLVVIWQAGHVLEEVAPVTLGASVGSIIAMDLVVSVVDRKAGHVSEEVAPHTVRAGVSSIRAVDLFGGSLGTVVVASAISTAVLPRFTISVGSTAVGFF